jgi:hypothetical protein
MASDLRRVPSSGAVEVGYPTGHFGHLTEHETQALTDFKTILEEKGIYKPGPPPSHDDPTLLCVPTVPPHPANGSRKTGLC